MTDRARLRALEQRIEELERTVKTLALWNYKTQASLQVTPAEYEEAQRLFQKMMELSDSTGSADGGSLNGPSRLGASHESDTGGEIEHAAVESPSSRGGNLHKLAEDIVSHGAFGSYEAHEELLDLAKWALRLERELKQAEEERDAADAAVGEGIRRLSQAEAALAASQKESNEHLACALRLQVERDRLRDGLATLRADIECLPSFRLTFGDSEFSPVPVSLVRYKVLGLIDAFIELEPKA